MSGRCVPGLRVSYGYKRLVKDVFPRDAHSSELNTRELERMTVYALTNTDKLTKIGLYIERRVGKKFARREYGHLRCAIAVLHNLMLVCHVDLRLFADSVVRLTKFLLRQMDEPRLHVLGCETLSKFASTLEEASQMHVITPFVDDLVRLCHDTQVSPGLRLEIREASLGAVSVLVQTLDSALSEQAPPPTESFKPIIADALVLAKEAPP